MVLKVIDSQNNFHKKSRRSGIFYYVKLSSKTAFISKQY